MASYFDLPPARSKAAAAPTAELRVPENSGFGKMSLLSPQVSAILDDLELNDGSSSENDKASLSGDSIPSDKDANTDRKSRPDKPNRDHGMRKVQSSPLPQPSKKVQNAAPPRPPVGGQRHPHLARFHSLRSMLFQSNIEANMHKAKETGAKDPPENQWKAEHEKRQALNRPKTPESPPKQGFAHKLGNSLRRLTSKEVPTMNSIREIADGNESSASDDEDDDERRSAAEDSEEINHSDIEDIMRWVSRRDPPSDGERSRTGTGVKEAGTEDSGHESLGHSDVDDLVRWVGRKDKGQTNTPAIESKQEDRAITATSDASTQSDSEDEPMDEGEVDDLVRWVSRREGPNAGPVHGKKSATSRETSSGTRDEDEDDMSGESDVPDKLMPQTSEEASLANNAERNVGSSLKTEIVAPSASESNAGLADEDVDELVQWMSRKKVAQE